MSATFTGGVTATNFYGNAATATSSTNATNASNTTIAVSNVGSAVYPTFVSATSGNQAHNVNTSLSFIPSTGTLSATNLSATTGTLTGNMTASGFSVPGGLSSQVLLANGTYSAASNLLSATYVPFSGANAGVNLNGQSLVNVNNLTGVSATFTGGITSASFNGALIGNVTGTATTASNLIGNLTGSIPYQSGANTTTMLAPTSAGQVLTLSGTSGAYYPVWQTAQGGGGGFTSITGASNQILVNNLTSAVTSGTISLTLPQSIGTTSNVQFANITASSASISGLLSGTSETLSGNLTVSSNLTASGTAVNFGNATVTANALTLTNDLAVSSGGTGVSNLVVKLSTFTGSQSTLTSALSDATALKTVYLGNLSSNPNGNSYSVTLPSPSINKGKTFIIKIYSTSSFARTFVIKRNGSENIENAGADYSYTSGAAAFTKTFSLISDGTDWWIESNF